MAGRYVTTAGRRLASIFIGTAVGGFLSAARVFLMSERAMDFPSEMGGPALYAAMSFVHMGLVWLVGIGVIGFPSWLLAEKRGRVGGWKSAAVFGTLVSFPLHFVATAMTRQLVWLTAHVPFQWSTLFSVESVIIGVLFALTGGVVALAMWRFAYRRAAAPQNAETFS